jgi:iron complex outermembrane recepter protein
MMIWNKDRGPLCRTVLICAVLVAVSVQPAVAARRTGQPAVSARRPDGPAQLRVRGHVLDGGGSPLPGAEVLLVESGSGLVRYGTSTDTAGAFLLEPVAAGRYTLRVLYLGYATVERAVLASVEDPEDLTIRLSRRAVEHPEAVVTGHRSVARLTPVTMTALDRATLSRQPQMKDLPAHLATLPSITMYSENGNGIGYSYLRMRGFGQRRLAVAINGIPQNDPEEFNVFWINFFDLDGVIDDIQVQRGAGSSFYGPAAIGGAINIRSMPYRPKPYAQLETGAGAFGTRRASIALNSGLLADRWVAFGRVSRLVSDGYRNWSWTEFWRLFGGVTRYGDRSTLTLQAYGGPQRDGLAYIGIPKEANRSAVDDGFGGTIDRRSNYSELTRDVEQFNQPHVELHHSLKLGDRADLNQSLFWIKGEGYFDFDGSFRSAAYLRLPDAFTPDRDQPLYVARPDVGVLFRAYLDQWQVGWQPSVTIRHALGESRIGGEVRLHRSLRWGRVQESDGIPEEFVGADSDYRVYGFRGEKSIQSVYVSHLYRPSEHLAVQADAQLTHRRYRVYEEAFFGTEFSKSYLFLNPRLGVTLFPEQPLSAYASLALANREPRMKTLYDGEEAGSGLGPQFEQNADGGLDTSSPFVRAERLIDFELGGTWKGERAFLTSNVFIMAFRNEIVPSGVLDQFGVPRTGNAARSRHAGLELDGGIRLAPGLDATANATFSRNRFREFTEFVTLPDFSTSSLDRAGRTIAGFPAQMANLGLTAVRAGITGSAFVTLMGRQFIDNSNATQPDGSSDRGLQVDPYQLVSVTIRYDLPETSPLAGLQASLDINNIFDARVLTFGNSGFGAPQFYPAATRHVYLGLRYVVR